MSKEKRYLQWGYDSFKDTKTGEISDNHIHLLNKQDEQISDLEAKLTEKDQIIENLQTTYQSVVQTCGNDANEIKKLKKQNDDYTDSLTKVLNENADLVFKLAEKEKEVENLKEQFDVFTIKNAFKYQNVIEKSKMQFAIDYAIEQLEELRLSFICNYHDNISWIDDRENSCCLNLTTTIYNTTIDIFNNQIAELTHQHEDKGVRK